MNKLILIIISCFIGNIFAETEYYSFLSSNANDSAILKSLPENTYVQMFRTCNLNQIITELNNTQIKFNSILLTKDTINNIKKLTANSDSIHYKSKSILNYSISISEVYRIEYHKKPHPILVGLGGFLISSLFCSAIEGVHHLATGSKYDANRTLFYSIPLALSFSLIDLYESNIKRIIIFKAKP